MTVHVAILKPVYARAILAGRKTIESRMTATRQPPHGCVAAGERIFLKESGGPFVGMARVAKVEAWDDASESVVRDIWRNHHAQIGGDPAYWKSKLASRYVTLVWLRAVEPIDVGPAYRVANMRAWYALDDTSSPVADVRLTDGAIRNRYVSVPAKLTAFPTGPATLLMPDGEVIESTINAKRLIGGRGWGRYHARHGLAAGDVVRLVAVEPGRYRVHFVKGDEQDRS
ncbi:MAG: ASCH domain-containing protein [Planctomycetota bacterium]